MCKKGNRDWGNREQRKGESLKGEQENGTFYQKIMYMNEKSFIEHNENM